MSLVILGPGIYLFDQHPIGRAIPDAAPRVVRPPEAEFHSRLTALENLVERPMKNSASTEPIVPIAEGLHTILLRQSRLRLSSFGASQIIKPQIGGNDGLTMASKQGLRSSNIRPLGKARSPP